MENDNSDSDFEFDGFTDEDVIAAQEKLDRMLERDSDIDFSDMDDIDYDSEDDIPLARLRHEDTSETENGDHALADSQWSSDLTPVVIDRFTGNPGPVTKLDKSKKEIDFFHLIFSEDLYTKIASETNRYARTKISENGSDRKWYDTTADEIKAFIAFNIVMGIIVAPNNDMYWSKDELFHPSGISERLPRDRFDKLCQYFHVADTSANPVRGQEGHDKIAHVRPIIDIIRGNIKNEYRPHCETSVDEAMIAYTGRLGIKQYVPLKPTKRGIKVWMRADPHNGYTNDFQVYTGKASDGGVEKGLGERVVKDLTRELWGKGHHVYCDNYFTSVPLFQELLENKTFACGTVRSHRKHLPQAVARSKLRSQGDVVQQQRGNLVATAWHDKRTVLLLTTNSSPTEMTTVRRKQRDGTVREVPCPLSIQNYTTHMNGVDRADQLRSSYAMCKKAAKWWKYLFWFVVDLSIVNSFILMRESTNHVIRSRNGTVKQMAQLDFRKNLVRQLISGFWGKRKREALKEKASNGLVHWPTVFTKKRTCKQCSKNKIRREPTTGCEQCQINLCVGCFKAYHKDHFPELFS